MRNREIKITSKGQITLPKSVRDRISVSEGDYLQVEVKGREIILRPAPKKTGQELLMEYAREHSRNRVGLEEVRRRLSGLRFSVSEQVSKLREEEP